jgi:hypothetical protein
VTGSIPEDVHRFILSSIESVEQLEVLLLMQAAPGVEWTPEAIALQLYSTPSSIGGRLAALVRQDLVQVTGTPPTYRYHPKIPSLASTVERLADCYRTRRVAVVTLIASKPLENVRAFSDAFRLRKKDKD